MTTLSTDHRGPFTHAPNSIQKTMVTVVVALMPATILDLVLFGWPAIFLFAVTVGSCVLIEAAIVQAQGRRAWPTITDGSALLTGWLLAMSLPPWAPWWIGVLGAVFAVALAKQVFGGLGQNVFNPAMVARVALLVSFPVQMTLFVAPHPLFAAGSPGLIEALGITFGKGTHHCVGSRLGQLEMMHAFTQLLDRVGRIEAAGDLPVGVGFFLHSPPSLPVILHPVQ